MFKFWYFDIVEFGKLGPWSSSEDEHWLELWHMRVGLNMKSLQSFGVLDISGKLDKAVGLIVKGWLAIAKLKPLSLFISLL